MKKTTITLCFFLIFCFIIYRCSDATENVHTETKGDITEHNENVIMQQGKTLAAQYCQSCHMLPDPSLLDKENWQTALAMMGPRLGIYSHNGRQYTIFTDIDQSAYPDKAAMSAFDWQNIIDYYTVSAPSLLPTGSGTKPVSRQLPFFSIQFPSQLFYGPGNTASLIKIDTSVQPHRIFVTRASSNTLFLLDPHLRVIDSIITNGPLVDIQLEGNSLAACKIGADLLGNNSKLGSIIIYPMRNGRVQPKGLTITDTLKRPVQISSIDLNGDNKKDYLVCEFGNMFGSLLWLENKGNGVYTRHDIRPVPGATRAYVRDDNHDGMPDIWAQFAQGEEGIFLFTNKSNGSFEQKQVMRFPPSYGSTFFELDDFNQDGFPDILYTCGDRGDGIKQLKPYHGVYIFLNNGKNEFKQQYFFPINGCIKALANDFDHDGDLDIAAIGLFTDNRRPEEGFIYLHNIGKMEFEPYSLSVETRFNKYTTMDVADYDGDGKTDIILGQGVIGNKSIQEKSPLFVVLKNRF